mgnify:CR=1 FL=1
MSSARSGRRGSSARSGGGRAPRDAAPARCGASRSEALSTAASYPSSCAAGCSCGASEICSCDAVEHRLAMPAPHLAGANRELLRRHAEDRCDSRGSGHISLRTSGQARQADSGGRAPRSGERDPPVLARLPRGRMINHGAYAAATSRRLLGEHAPTARCSPRAGSRAASAGAEQPQRISRGCWQPRHRTMSEGAEAVGQHERGGDAVGRGIRTRRCDGLRVDVNAGRRASRRASPRRSRECLSRIRSRAPSPAGRLRGEPFEAESGRRMRAGAERRGPGSSVTLIA